MGEDDSRYRRFLDGDMEAFAEIVEAYRESLIRFLCRFIGDTDQAEDLAEDVFVEVLLHPKRYRFSCSLKTWLFTIGRNKAVSHIRKHARTQPYGLAADLDILQGADVPGQLLADGGEGEAGPGSRTEAAVLEAEEKAMLQKAMAGLHADYREALTLLYFEDLPVEACARVMGKSRKQVENLAYRGKNALRKAMQQMQEEGAQAPVKVTREPQSAREAQNTQQVENAQEVRRAQGARGA